MTTAPAFWWRDKPNFTATTLRPIAAVYGAITARRMARPGTALPAAVICVGNFVAGGAGKTPTALALAQLLTQAGHRPAFLSRGYGRAGSTAGRRAVLRVDPTRHNFTDTGDEPLLLAAIAPTYVSTDRVAAGRRALIDGANVLVLDDGLQSPLLTKSASIAVIDGAAGIGNGLCLPAGPLRAPLAAQWPWVSAVCLIGNGSAGDHVAAEAAQRGLSVWRARLMPDMAVIAALRGRPLYAFAGIGRPSKFFTTLETNGLRLCGRRTFSDHHRFSVDDLAGLVADAARLGAQLVTTSKDRVRLPAAFPAIALPVSLSFDDGSSPRRWVEAVVAAAR